MMPSSIVPRNQTRTFVPEIRTRNFGVVVLLGALAALLGYGAWMWGRIHSDPKITFLTSSGSAEWIRHDDPVDLATRAPALLARGFRTRIEVSNTLNDATVRLRVFQRCSVLIDGRVVANPPLGPRGWKAGHAVQLAPHLTPGVHELLIVVQNETGPPLLWLSSDSLNVHSNVTWQSTADGVNWKNARLARERPGHPIAAEFPTPASALLARWPLFGAVFALFAAVAWRFPGRMNGAASATDGANQHPARARLVAITKSPARIVRWLLLAGWVAMAANNLFKLPAPAGFDTGGHVEYINFLLTNKRVPLATDGWQMFQSPLYYLLSAGLYLGVHKLVEPATAVLLLRLLPLACGLLQIELCYRATRRIFPHRNDLQIIGTTFAALLPMNIYLSSYVGNESLSGALSGAVFVLCLKLLVPRGEDVRWTPLWLGVLFGLALLAKVSAVLVGLPLLLALAWSAFTASNDLKTGALRLAGSAGFITAAVGAIAGWYYIRNWIHLGRPFVGGWDPSRGYAWWQDPGFRTASDYFSFGTALVRPIYAGLVSFWDGLYASFWSDSYLSSAVSASFAPKWNYGFVTSSVLFAMVPSAALLVGMGVSVKNVIRNGDATWLITLACVGVYLLALLHLTLTVPYYCSIKAFYTVGAIPAYALLLVTGYDLLTRHPIMRGLMHGLFACWAVSVYVAYFARA